MHKHSLFVTLNKRNAKLGIPKSELLLVQCIFIILLHYILLEYKRQHFIVLKINSCSVFGIQTVKKIFKDCNQLEIHQLFRLKKMYPSMVISICQNVFVYFRKYYLGSHVSVSHELLFVVHEGRRYITITVFETKKKMLVPRMGVICILFLKSVLTTVLNFY